MAVAPASDPGRGTELARALTYCILFGALAAFAWAYRQGFYHGQPFPRNTFLFAPGDHFRDLTNFFPFLASNDPYAYWASVYPPFMYIAMEPFEWLGVSGSVLLWTVLAVGGIGYFVARQLDFLAPVDRIAATLAMTVATYGFLFSYDRGNLELLAVLALVALVLALQTGHLTTAAVAVGFAAALKGYPIVFAALFLVRGQWRPLAISVVTAGLLTVLGTIYYGFDVFGAVDQLRANLTNYNDQYVGGDNGLAYGASLFAALKLLLYAFGGDADTARAVLPAYTAVTALLAIGLVVALWRLPLRFWEQITLLVIALILLPGVSADYKLLHLTVPMVLFLREGADDRLRWFYLVAFAVLAVPKAYVLLRPDVDGTNLGVLVNPLVMLAIAVAILVSARRRPHTRGERGSAYRAPAAA